jgi:hypothetical protein
MQDRPKTIKLTYISGELNSDDERYNGNKADWTSVTLLYIKEDSSSKLKKLYKIKNKIPKREIKKEEIKKIVTILLSVFLSVIKFVRTKYTQIKYSIPAKSKYTSFLTGELNKESPATTASNINNKSSAFLSNLNFPPNKPLTNINRSGINTKSQY